MIKKLIYPFYSNWRARKEIFSVILFIRKIFHKVHYNYSPQKKVVVINTVQLSAVKSLKMELTLARNLQMRGNHVILVYCDGLFTHCDRVAYPSSEKDSLACRACKMKTKLIKYFVKNIEVLPYSALIDKKDISEIEKGISDCSSKYIRNHDDNICFSGIDLKNDIISSVVRYIHDGTLFFNDRTSDFFCSSLRNAKLGVLVGENIIKRFKPDVCISLHAVYSSWAPLMSTMRKNGVRNIVYGKGQAMNNTLIFYEINQRVIRDFTDGWKRNKDRRLKKSEENRLKQYLDKRFNRSIGFTEFQKTTMNSYSKVREIPFDEYYTYFPNVAWDNSMTGADKIFSNPLNCIFETVNWFGRHPSLNLVIRAHPSEASYQSSRRSLISILRIEIDGFDEMKNVYFIHPEENLSSYNLMSHSKAILVYNGTLGLEASYKNVPVIYGGKPDYENESGLYMPDDKNEFFSLILDPVKIITHNIENHKNLIRFMYFLFFEFEIIIPFLKGEKWYEFDDKNIDVELIKTNSILEYLSICIENSNYDFSSWREETVNSYSD